jgi:hypothetical protein
LAHFLQAVDAQILAVTARDREPLGAEKEFAVFGVVQEAIDAQGDRIARRRG